MKKRILPLLLSCAMAGTLLVPAIGYAAASATQKIDQELSQLKKEQAAAKKKASQAKNEIARVQDEKKETTKDMNELIQQLNEAGKRLSELTEEIDTVSDELQENGRQLDEAIARVESRDQMLKSRLRLMYMNGFVSYMDVLLSSTNFSDFLSRLEALKSIVTQDKEILEANKRDKNTVEKKKQETEEQLKQVQQLYAEASSVRKELQVKEKEKEVKIASLSKQEKALEHITEEQEEELIQIAAKEAQLQAKKRAATKAKSPFTYTGGQFGYPLAVQAPLTSDFVLRINPVTGKSENHKGIDLGAPKGTEIRAAENGSVIHASWMSGYGNTVIIDHGNGVWTLYGHILTDGIAVKKGDTVKRGQKIAEVGSTGQSTGYHLHFEVRVNQTPVDPKPYLR